MGAYRQYGPRQPPNAALRRGILYPDQMTAEYLAARVHRMRGYEPPDILGAAENPYVGVTSDGHVVPGLYTLEDEGFDVATSVAAANELHSALSPEERDAMSQALQSTNWRKWTNAFPTWEPHGLLIEDLTTAKRLAVLSVIESCLSPSGYEQARQVMHLNRELGQLLGQYHDTLTEWMYWFSIFGTPSLAEPWGWQLYGHHLDLNCLIIGSQMVLTPAFLGSEIESQLAFAGERRYALELVNTLPVEHKAAATMYERFADLPHELQGPLDGRHVGGGGQDNREVPYEGLPVRRLRQQDFDAFTRLVGAWTSRLPTGSAQAAVSRILSNVDETYFAWYGPTGGDSAFYYRIHSPVVLIEYDNHPGIFLDNDEPEPFHVHTIVRAPNGNDYGRDLLRQHLEKHHH
jgi:hypothetical protein